MPRPSRTIPGDFPILRPSPTSPWDTLNFVEGHIYLFILYSNTLTQDYNPYRFFPGVVDG